ncbi:MAG: methyltransferase domain-containing protein, partial [Deltaproteobacteria bacterium]|nr:methyltransferase domain-containing protein [Deltaproteobacteria bacterium]
MELSCPRCASTLPQTSAGSIPCTGCGAQWPVVAGIPDLRVHPDPYIALDEDREKAERLAREGEGLSPAALVDLYFSLTPEVPPGLASGYRRGMLELGPARAEDRLERLQHDVPRFGQSPRVLDLGCGAGAWLPSLGARAGELVGVDVALRWLVVARAVLRARGIEATLICGNAESLPLSRNSFDVVIAANVLEHARDAEASLNEVFRVLDKDGYAYIATPNRFSVLPEPHVGVPGLGLLPRAAADEIVRRALGVPYGGITLRGSLGWTDLATSAGFRRVQTRAPVPGRRERDLLSRPGRLAARALAATAGNPVGRGALRALGPMLEV